MVETKKVKVYAPGASCVGDALEEAFQQEVALDSPDQYFRYNCNRAIVSKYNAKTVDAILGIDLRRMVKDALQREFKELSLMEDIAAFEVTPLQPIELMLDVVNMLPCMLHSVSDSEV